MYFSDPGFILRHQEGRLIDLEAKGVIGADDGIAPGAAAYEQAAGDIEGDHLVARLIQVLHQRGCHTFQFPVETGAKHRIDEYIPRRHRMKMFLALDKPDFDRCLMEPFQIGLEIVRADMTKLENVNGYGAVLSGQQAGERKAV